MRRFFEYDMQPLEGLGEALNQPAHDSTHPTKTPQGRYLFALALGALGVVYGDIGTSPIYAFRESFQEAYGIPVSPENVLGVLSLIFWSLIIVISIKYLVFVMRADNHGEGGIMALTALVTPKQYQRRTGRWLIILLGIFGASLLYGDSMITPAISVLSAVEGLEVAAPALEPFVIPITVVILIGLFAFQSRGTASVGALFGPVTFVWFVTLATLGAIHIADAPQVLGALNPLQGAEFFTRNAWPGVLVLGSVFLVVTGGEALYADMGHFGKKPIRLAWFAFVLPALLLNYFGQGAMILSDPAAVRNPFFLMAPEWARFPLIILATVATVIASQAVISGAFSLTRQAVQLGYLPRLDIVQTSNKEIGQVYIPAVNWIVMIACIGLVFGFRSSSNLAAAYGVGVTTDMVFTTLLFAVVARSVWKWPLLIVVPLVAGFLIVDLGFWVANLTKIPGGGWFPLLVGAIMFTFMTTWRRGRQILGERLRAGDTPIKPFVAKVKRERPTRVSGTAVFMHSQPNATPHSLHSNFKHNHVLHERIVLLAIKMEEVPRVAAAKRADFTPLGEGFYQIILHYGFMEEIDVPKALAELKPKKLEIDTDDVTYFLGRETLFATKKPGMAIWRENLFIVLSKNARSAASFFSIPPDQVIEIGAQVEL